MAYFEVNFNLLFQEFFMRPPPILVHIFTDLCAALQCIKNMKHIRKVPIRKKNILPS